MSHLVRYPEAFPRQAVLLGQVGGPLSGAEKLFARINSNQIESNQIKSNQSIFYRDVVRSRSIALFRISRFVARCFVGGKN